MHYVYNKQGAANALGLSSINEINRYKNNAISAGKIPCKNIGGVEMYDIDILLYKSKKRIISNNHGYKANELKTFANGVLFIF